MTERIPSRRTLLATVVGLLVLGSALGTGLIVLRIEWTGEPGFLPLVWNLFLAWLPLLLALVLVGLHRARAHGVALVAVGLPWLLLLPNAPYIVTDLVHLAERPGVPVWFDAVLISCNAAVGLGLGLLSLYLVHRVVAARRGAVAGWVVALGCLPLAVVGVWLGRVHRFNSWDVVHPGRLVETVIVRLGDPLGDPRLVVVGIAGTLGLAVAYAAVVALAAASRVQAR